ncbi:MAG: pyruvate dehydrogenase (acetyl-transferring), homodimeric type [Planctomycetota bacterium]
MLSDPLASPAPTDSESIPLEARGQPDGVAQETRDWVESLDDVLASSGPARASELLVALQQHAQRQGILLPVTSRTPYVNTIAAADDPPYPGDRELERRIKSLVRWNAMAMVVRANRELPGIGGHISTYASTASLYEVGFHHFFRGHDDPSGGDLFYFQGHASPGIYARAFLEGRFGVETMESFRRELRPGGGLSSYPHPWLMPEFWEFPTVPMGLGPLQALYRARFMRYLEKRGLKEPSGARVWCFIGDGETNEPESLGAISMAARKGLDNLIFVVNCNLQRLDGPVRGNGKIIQELEAVFRGVGWNVIKVLWGEDWDPLLARDDEGLLVERMGEVIDGEYQNYRVRGGSYIRAHFWGADPRLLRMVEHLSDEELFRLRIGGHDPVKIHSAYRAAVEHRGAPTVILAHTIKGYGLGEAGEGKNVTHSQKKLNEQELLKFRDRFCIPISDSEVGSAPFYRPPDDSPEIEYLRERRRALGGFVPARRRSFVALPMPAEDVFAEFYAGTGETAVSTTMALVKMLAKMLRDEEFGPRLVPIVPDEARTFGMEALFRQVGLYSGVGQLYEPVDSGSLLYYRQIESGQILEEGITEAGAMSSLIAAGTSHTAHQTPMVPMYFFYSMFGFQRIGDLVWAAADCRTRGFLIGATSGRTTLAGEGLQHQDGHSHLLAQAVPNLEAYDPAFAYEIAVIVQDGLHRMYRENEDVFYYLTVTNESYPQAKMPEGSREGILRGLYRLRKGRGKKDAPRVQLLASGAILNESLLAADLLAEGFGVVSDVWSVTSWKRLRDEALDVERGNLLHPDAEPRQSHLQSALAAVEGPFVAASDYVKALPDALARWIPGQLVSLGTDGFGRSDGRAALRDFFEVDARHIAFAALRALAREGRVPGDLVTRAATELQIDPEKPNPRTA